MVLPFFNSTMLSLASLATATLERQRRYSSRDMAGKLPASKRRSTISVSGVPGPTLAGWHVVHLEIAIVAHDQLVAGVEEAQALRHVVDGGVELEVADFQRFFLLADELILLLQLRAAAPRAR